MTYRDFGVLKLTIRIELFFVLRMVSWKSGNAALTTAISNKKQDAQPLGVYL